MCLSTNVNTDNLVNHSSGNSIIYIQNITMSRVSTYASTRQSTSLQGETESVGFTCVAPNEERRAEICQALGNQRNLPRCNYVGRLGEQNAGHNPRNDGTTNKQQRSSKAIEKEKNEIAKMKRNQRRKANMNEMRERERTIQLDEDRKLKNEAFLSRFKQDPAQSAQ